MYRSICKPLALVLLAVVLLAACGVENMPAHSALIINGGGGKPIAKLDAAGKQLDAHEGAMVYADGRYWMVGNTYGCGYQWIHAKTPWCGFRVYSSPDLVSWTDLGLAFDPARFQSLCGYGNLGCFDARLIFDASAHVWRMWFNAYMARSGYVVMTASTPKGPYKQNPLPNLAVGNNHPGRGNGAGGLFLDSDGTGYLAYTAWTMGGAAVVEELDSHLLNGTGRHSLLNIPNAEAPSLLREPDGTYAVVYDDPGCAWCGATGTAYATAKSPMGPWTARGRLSDRTCGGQKAGQISALPSPTGTVWLFLSDQFTNLVTPRPANWTGMSDLQTVGHWNQTNATQLWEPLTFSRGLIHPLQCPDQTHVPLA